MFTFTIISVHLASFFVSQLFSLLSEVNYDSLVEHHHEKTCTCII